MTSIAIDRTDGLSSSTAIKGPCRVATTANISLTGTQTIDGVAVVADDRVLVKNQTTASENGIYVVDTGPWRRAKDFSGNRDVKTGTQVYVTSGTNGAAAYVVSTANPIVIGTTSIAFTSQALGILPAIVRDYLDVAPYVADRTALAALDSTKDTVAFVKATADQNQWVWNGSNLAADVAADVAGIFEPPTGGDGSTGAFVWAGARSTGSWWRSGSVVNPAGGRMVRLNDRVLVGYAASAIAGETSEGGGVYSDGTNNFIGYLDRSAALAAYSPTGGVGGSFASMSSDKYTYLGLVDWAAGVAVTTGDRRGSANKVYEATTTGTTGATRPVHTSGTASDGTVTWQYIDHTYHSTIALASYAIQDLQDPNVGVWAYYGEVTRITNGSAFWGEIAVKNRGDNITLTPYNGFGGVMGMYFAGGGDASYGGAPSNPSTVAILIKKNSQTFNTGIIFANDAITGTDGVTGTGVAVAMARGHELAWYYTGGGKGFAIRSEIDASADHMRLVFDTTGMRLYNDQGTEAFRVLKSSGTLTAFVQLAPSTAGTPIVAAAGDAADINLIVKGKGTGGVRLTDGSNNNKVQVNSTGVGFHGTVPIAKPTVAAAGTDAATTQTLANSIRTILINYGLAAA